MSRIHDKAAVGFERAGEEYHKGRPDYPQAAIDFILKLLKESSAAQAGLSSKEKIVEVGAGTGKFSKLLIDAGIQSLTAIEPVAGMRKKYAELLPGHEILAGTAEHLPLLDQSCDVLIAAQAFHWFANAETMKEFRRVLKPGGMIILIWNARDEDIPWISALTDIIDPYQGDAPRYKSGEWKKVFQPHSGFSPLENKIFSYEQLGDYEMLINRVTSISFISALPESERQQVIQRVRDLVAGHPDLQGKTQITLPYRTDLFWCTKQIL